MAKIIWKPRAIRQLNAIIDFGVPEFGMVAFNRLDKRIQETENRLEQFPESYPLEPLLLNDHIMFRSCILRKRHKIIYHYNKAKDTVYLDDIWDMRMNPTTLKKRIKH